MAGTARRASLRSAAPWARRTRQTCISASRRLFDGLLALSGIYTSEYGFPGYMDELVYANSPVDYLAGISPDHPFIRLYNDHKAIIVVGQGAWELPESTFRLRDICQQKDIHVWFDIWGYDVKHDWDWWYQQVAYHVPHIL